MTLHSLGKTLLLGALTACSGWATMITGTVSIGGTAAVGASTITFATGVPSCSTFVGGATNGCFLTGAANGSFAIDTNTNGIVQDLASGTPISGPTSIPQFIVFSNGVTFDLVNLPVAVGPSCSVVNTSAPNVSCVPGANSAFQITNGSTSSGGNAVNSTIQFTVGLNGYIGSSAQSTPYVGIFTASLNQNASQILAVIGSGGTIANQYAATFQPVTTTPEPGSLMLLGFGLIGLTTVSRRFAKR